LFALNFWLQNLRVVLQVKKIEKGVKESKKEMKQER